MFKRFTQVRDTKLRWYYGQVVDIDHTNVVNGVDVGNPRPYFVQWMEGSSQWESEYFLRRETFLEFLFRRPGYMGKHRFAHALFWNAFMVGVGIAAWWIALPFFVGYYFWHYLNFKGILR